QTDEASQRLERMVEQRRKTGNAGELQVALRYLAYVRFLQTRRDEALTLLREAIGILEKVTAAPIARASHKLALAGGTRDAGLLLLDTGDAAQALRHLDDARQRYAGLQGRVSPDHADALVGAGRARLALGRAQEALALFEQADDFWRDFDADNRWAGEAAYWLARCYEALDRHAEAKQAYARAAKILARSPLPADKRLARLARSGALAVRAGL
ncbi:MAG: tetratricopeptide repeat protein, partial [Burkholderiaceae bacterium]